jgi:hypothetical protein
MKTRFSRYIVTSLLGLTLLAGCAARDGEVRTEDGSTSAQGRDQVNIESKSKSTRSKSLGQTDPPNITYRPGAEG